MTSISINKNLSEEFFSDILITAFDGAYGASWQWFEPTPSPDKFWLLTKGSVEKMNASDSIWMSAKVRLQEECETGVPLFDTREGFVIDHDAIAGGISRIINDDYLGVWRPATPSEEDAIDGETINREWRAVANEHGTGYEVHTGETARGLRSIITRAVQDEEAGDIDAECADAIVQAAAFGKVIFG